MKRIRTISRAMFAVLLVMHGIAHTPGVLGSWNLATFDDVSRQPNILLGQAGDPVVYLLGAAFLIAGLGFITAGIGMLRREMWSRTALAIALVLSLVVTTLWWQDATVGLVINIGVLLVLGGMFIGSRRQQPDKEHRQVELATAGRH